MMGEEFCFFKKVSSRNPMIMIFLILFLFIHSQLPDIHNDRYFRDPQNRVRIFHGLSRVTKEYPWYDELLLDDVEIKKMAEFGYNVVRLGWMWSGFNPAEGVFNDTYFKIVLGTVKRFEKYGIYVFLDVHQDVLSEEFCLYDGVPKWVINKTLGDYPKSEDFPFPFKGGCDTRNWMANILTKGAANAYECIYLNYHGCQDNFLEFWKQTVIRWKDVTGILGYEIINEPFADEPVTWGMVLDGDIVGSGFDRLPGGTQYSNASCYSYHYYCFSFLPDPEGHKILRRVECDKMIGPEVFKTVDKHIKEVGGTSMLTEFCAADLSDEEMEEECAIVAEMADEHFQSWTDWNIVTGEFFPSMAYTDVFSRTYARAISGNPVNSTYNYKTKEFELCYQPEDYFTEIYYNNNLYDTLDIKTTEGLEFDLVGEQIINVKRKGKYNAVECISVNNKQ